MVRILLLIVTISASLFANANLITFNELETGNYYNDFSQPSYEYNDFILSTKNSFHSLGSLHPAFGTSTGIHAEGVSADIVLKRIDNKLFNAISIDLLIGLYNSYDDSIPILFTGIRDSGETVNQLFQNTYGIDSYSTFNFNDDFSGLKALTWQQGAIYHSFDNINLRSPHKVPEPPSILLILSIFLIVIQRIITR